MGKTAKIIIISTATALGIAGIVAGAVNWNKLARKGAEVIGDVTAANVNWDKTQYDNDYIVESSNSATKTCTLKYADNAEYVKIPGAVQISGTTYAVTVVNFQNSYAKAVKTPDSVTSFYTATNDDTYIAASLQYAYLGKGVTSLPNYAFSGTKSLKKVFFSGDLASLGVEVFANSGIESFEVPETVTSWDTNTFVYATNLKTLTFKNGADMGKGLNFQYDFKLESLTLPEISKDLSFYQNYSLTSLSVPEKASSLSLKYCTALDNVTIPSAVETLYMQGTFLKWALVKGTSFTVAAASIEKTVPVFFEAYKSDVSWSTLATERTNADQKVYYKGQWKLVNNVPQAIEGAEASVKATTSSSSAA